MQVLLYLIYIYTQGKDESEFHLGERGRARVGRYFHPLNIVKLHRQSAIIHNTTFPILIFWGTKVLLNWQPVIASQSSKMENIHQRTTDNQQ